MYERVLLALDLEGVNKVVGVPYSGLSKQSDEWAIAVKQAVLEVNSATEALFLAGVKKVGLWDNHGGGGNINPADLDARIELFTPGNEVPRMQFAKGQFDCICYFGYHAMEGTLGGVLAHTMNSREVQFYKLNGKYIGEVDIDYYIASELGLPSIFFAGGDIACKQAKRVDENIITVETKKELSRNQAIFRDNKELLSEIKSKITKAVFVSAKPKKLKFPVTLEKSFKRTEDAYKHFEKLNEFGVKVDFLSDDVLGKDAHTVVAIVNSIEEFIKSI